MNNNDKSLQETKKLNQQAKQGNMTSSTSATEYNSPSTEEARQLNSQIGSSAVTSSTSSSDSSSLEETKKLNQQSRQGKSQ